MENKIKDQLIEAIEQQIAFEKQRELTKEWTKDYMEGYIDGLYQAINHINQIF